MSKIKFICFEGPDMAGKSTFIDFLTNPKYKAELMPGESHYPFKEIKFNKVLPSGELLRINTEKDFELLFTSWKHLDPNNIYILDRFILSNLVYDKVFRGESTAVSEMANTKFKNEFDVLEIILTRDYIHQDFLDDKITIPKDKFNAVIDEYKKYGIYYHVVKHNVAGTKVDAIDEIAKFDVMERIVEFANQ
jgi:hypothetical protein